MSDARQQEQKSAAVTLSDMELFIFPELMYSLVLANIMSPRIWRWRDDPWFDGLDRMRPYRRITRIKQYIMDHYIFNLDLDTWGLTTKARELDRFEGIIDADTLAQSNALFGYEGDRYYFDIDIRRHFGLDQYEGETIPYWKTETVEAMDGFKFRPNYETGAGECVSLATLYAAALFVVGGIPLEDIFLMATPLHSQNFVDLDDGILTNNRRLVTKNMWFNGTALSAQARRALENERVTIVAHATGCIHTVYEDATIDPAAYERFGTRVSDFLSTPVTGELLGNFLRHHGNLQPCFQFNFVRHGVDHYIAMERVFAYEHGSPYRITDNSRKKLLEDVDSEELMHDPLPGRMVFNDVEALIKQKRLDLRKPEDADVLRAHFSGECCETGAMLEKLLAFCHVVPRLPDADQKQFSDGHAPLGVDLDMSREEIMARLESIRQKNLMADMAFYAYRDLSRTEPAPFLKAALQRNPVAAASTSELDGAALAAQLETMPNESIYDGPGRLAQPDEVWNCGRGDGIEKAVLLADVLLSREARAPASIAITARAVTLQYGDDTYQFETSKQLPDQTWDLLDL